MIVPPIMNVRMPRNTPNINLKGFFSRRSVINNKKKIVVGYTTTKSPKFAFPQLLHEVPGVKRIERIRETSTAIPVRMPKTIFLSGVVSKRINIYLN